PWCGSYLGSKPATFRLREVLGDWATKIAILADQDVRQTAVAALSSEFLPGVELPTWLARAARHHDRSDILRLEYPERCLRKVVGQVDELLSEAQIRFVGAEPAHRLGVRESRQRRCHVDADQPPNRRNQNLGELNHVVLLDEAHLNVELSEFRLPIRPEIL